MDCLRTSYHGLPTTAERTMTTNSTCSAYRRRRADQKKERKYNGKDNYVPQASANVDGRKAVGTPAASGQRQLLEQNLEQLPDKDDVNVNLSLYL